MGKKRQVRCAIVGLGRIGSLLESDALREKPCTHAGAIAANPDCLLVGGADTDGERRRHFAERWDCEAVFASAEDLLRETRPDILHVATHPDSHYDYVRLAAKHGVRVAVCEKPLADTLGKAKKLAALHSSGKITVLTNHERRYSEDYRKARAVVEGGTYGRLLSAEARLYFGRTRRLLGQMIHDGTHLVDILGFLTGGILKKTGITGNLGLGKGTAYITAVSKPEKSGPRTVPVGGPRTVPVIITVGAERNHLVFELDLSFEAGRLRIGNGIYEEWESKESRFYEGFRSLERVPTPAFEKTGYFANMVKDAVACFREPGREPVSSAVHGLAALKFILSL